MSDVNYFADSFLDRSSEKRKDQVWIESQLKSNDTQFILFHIDRPLVRYTDDTQTRCTFLKLNFNQIESFLQKNCPYIFLGLEYDKLDETRYALSKSPFSHSDTYDREKSKAWFVIETHKFDNDADNVSKLFENGKFLDGNFMRLVALNKNEASILSQARSILCWHDRNQYCSTCGNATSIGEAGYKRTCPNQTCKSNIKRLNIGAPSNVCYPRVDPVVIMLIVNPEKTHFLLGRKKSFPKHLFSCLAGFVEPGESVEEAVRREIHEECGIYTSEIVFHSTQPWPFPSNLMIGVLAYATSNEIKVDNNEIEEAKWFSIEEIGQIIKNEHPDSIMIPPSRAIANRLINHWFLNKSKL